MQWAAFNNSNIDILSSLILEGADVNAKGVNGNTPLDFASTPEKRVAIWDAGGRSGQ
jgi:ankyrin repeat protein